MVAVHNRILVLLAPVEVELLALIVELEEQVHILTLEGAWVGDPGVDGTDICQLVVVLDDELVVGLEGWHQFLNFLHEGRSN